MRCRNEYFFGGPGKSPKLNISQDTMNGVYIGGSNIEGGGGGYTVQYANTIQRKDYQCITMCMPYSISEAITLKLQSNLDPIYNRR